MCYERDEQEQGLQQWARAGIQREAMNQDEDPDEAAAAEQQIDGRVDDPAVGARSGRCEFAKIESGGCCAHGESLVQGVVPVVEFFTPDERRKKITPFDLPDPSSINSCFPK